jgi:hypothetical protein
MFCGQIKQDSTPTERSVLRAIASIYDPLCLLSPVIIQCKIFMQQLWQIKVYWDDLLPTEFKELWHGLQHKYPIVNCIQIDRLIISKGKVTRIKFHGFSYASAVAYGACMYIRSIDVQGKITAKLHSSKSRVARLKRLSLPRL